MGNRQTMKSFLIEFPESDDILSLYYALQDHGLPCEVVRNEVDPKLIKVTPAQSPSDWLVMSGHICNIKGFILGWKACYYREAQEKDTSLQPTPGVIGRG